MNASDQSPCLYSRIGPRMTNRKHRERELLIAVDSDADFELRFIQVVADADVQVEMRGIHDYGPMPVNSEPWPVFPPITMKAGTMMQFTAQLKEQVGRKRPSWGVMIAGVKAWPKR